MFTVIGHTIGAGEPGSGGNMQISKFKKLDVWLYEASYNTLDYSYAKAYFDNKYLPAQPAGCSAVRNGNFFGRNFDWTYDESITLVAKTAPGDGIYATLGVVGSVPGLNRKVAESGAFDSSFMIAPFCLVDGINSEGLMCNINMLIPETSKGRTTGTVAAVEERERVCMLMLVRFILDHYATVAEAVADIRDYVSVYAPDGSSFSSEFHFMLADATSTVILEFVNNALVVTEVGPEESYPSIMTNFYLDGVTPNDDGTITRNTSDDPEAVNVNGVTTYGSGIERHNLAVAGYSGANTFAGMKALMRELFFTQAYTLTSDKWYSEFVGGDLKITSPDADFATVIAEQTEKYVNRSREKQSENYGTWQTVHSVVYDIAAKKLAICVQEGNDYVEFSLSGNAGGSVDIEQGRGQSTTSVMSQKAVTDELTQLEDKSNKVTSISSQSTDTQYPSAKAVYSAVHPANGSAIPVGGMLPNVLYILGTITEATTMSLATPDDAAVMNHYYFTFEIGSTVPQITWDAAITSWKDGGAPVLNENCHYEVSVLGGVAVIMEV